MTEVLPFIITGLTTGAVYGLAGIGLVLTYKTSGIFNFAHGAIAAVAAYVFYSTHVSQGWSWPLAAAVAVLVLGPLMGLVLELLGRAIQGSSLALQVASTVGLLLVIEAIVVLIYGTLDLRIVPKFLPQGDIRVAGTNVQWSDIITFAFALAVTTGLSIMFRTTRLGVAMRAVVDNPALLDLSGTSPARTRRFAWAIGTTLAAASGVLFAPLLPLDPIQLTLLVVAAFGAAAVGAFTSLPLTFAGGLLIGVLASLSTKYFTTGVLAGLPPALPFVVLFVVLLVFPRRYLVAGASAIARPRGTWAAPPSLQLGSGVVLLAGLATVPAFAVVHLGDWTIALGTAIVFLSLGLLVRTSGQVSLAHVTFMAIGAAAFSHLVVDQSWPWALALAGAGLVAVPVGALLAIPAIRLTGLYLALATFGFGVLLQFMFYTQDFMFGDSGLGLEMPRPAGFDGDSAYYYLVLGLAGLATVMLAVLDRTRLGRLLRGLADSPTALETSGAAVNVTRVLVFCLSAFMAAVGGALIGVAQTTVSADAFPPLLSLTYFVLIVIVVGGNPWYALMAAAGLVLIPSYVTGEQVSTYLQLLFGVAAILVAVLPGRTTQVPAPVRRLVDSAFGRRRRDARAQERPAGGAGRVEPGALEIHGLQVRFGGVVAVDDLTLLAPTGRITGLIGPNGAGKTTTFNACSGLNRPSRGRALLDGHDVSHRSPSARARRGLGRTFQKMELFESLSVRDNVAMGAEGTLAGGNPLRHLAGRRSDAATIRTRTQHALELCDIAELADAPVSTLSTGQRRLVELARCLAGPYRILLLDEPSSGLDRAETVRFGAILKRVLEERGVGILLVEHDMSLVLDVCDMVYVLDFGRPVFEGTPGEVVNSPIVQAAYLGDTAVEAAQPVVGEEALR